MQQKQLERNLFFTSYFKSYCDLHTRKRNSTYLGVKNEIKIHKNVQWITILLLINS